MSDRRVSKEELGAFWRGDKNTYQKMYSDRMQLKANEAEKQGKQVTYIPNDGSAILSEISVTAPRETEELKNLRLKLDYENFTDNAITAAGFIPGLDTFSDIADTANLFKQGNWGWGLVGLGALTLPGISSNHIRKGINWLKGAVVGKTLNKSLNANMIQDTNDRFRAILQTLFIDNSTKMPTFNLSKTADFSKALSNIQLLDRMDEFASKYGYPLSDRSTILSNRKTNKQARDLIARHNTYLRGVMPKGFEPDDLENVQKVLGKNISDEEFMKYAATHSRPNQTGIWISPESNAFIYGSNGKTALVRRKYNLGKNRNKWFEEGGFEILTNPINVNLSWDTAKGIIAPWDDYKQITKGSENELISIEDLNFAGWANFDNWRHRVSLNNKVLNKNIPIYSYWKKGGKL